MPSKDWQKTCSAPNSKKTPEPRIFILGFLFYLLCALFLMFFYDPANGVPKRPTASSAQIKRNNITIPTATATQYLPFFLITQSTARPVLKMRIPIITKSLMVQGHFANNGISNKPIVPSAMRILFLFFMVKL